jgi:hypothetical protein
VLSEPVEETRTACEKLCRSKKWPTTVTETPLVVATFLGDTVATTRMTTRYENARESVAAAPTAETASESCSPNVYGSFPRRLDSETHTELAAALPPMRLWREASERLKPLPKTVTLVADDNGPFVRMTELGAAVLQVNTPESVDAAANTETTNAEDPWVIRLLAERPVNAVAENHLDDSSAEDPTRPLREEDALPLNAEPSTVTTAAPVVMRLAVG